MINFRQNWRGHLWQGRFASFPIDEPRFRRRLSRLPAKYPSAMLAAEIGSSMVYQGDSEADFADSIRLHLARSFPEKGQP